MTDYPKIDPKAKEAWLQALTSGEYEQTQGALHDGRNGYCCLGVLAAVQGCEFETATSVRDPDGADVNESGLLSQYYADQFGLTAKHQELLSTLNDGGELILRKEAPLYDLAAKLAKDVADNADYPNRTAFLVDKRSFEEIAEVIRENF